MESVIFLYGNFWKELNNELGDFNNVNYQIGPELTAAKILEYYKKNQNIEIEEVSDDMSHIRSFIRMCKDEGFKKSLNKTAKNLVPLANLLSELTDSDKSLS